MKRLPRFAYAAPSSVTEAAALLAAAAGAGQILAGGTDLLVDLKLGKTRPELVVDLKGIAGLSSIRKVEGGVRLGALAPVAAVAASETVRVGHRALWRAAGVLGTPPVRRLATVGGNLGRGSPASDLTPALIAHGARLVIQGPQGIRELSIGDLPSGPGVTSLEVGEIITEVFLPDAPPGTGSAHRKLGKRGGGWDLALVAVSVSITLGARGEVAEARIALASVGPTALRAGQAEERLLGLVPDAAALAAAAEAAAAEAQPISDLRATAGYRRELVGVLTRRAVAEALDQARAAEEMR